VLADEEYITDDGNKPRFRMKGAVTHHPYMPSWCGQGQMYFLLSFYYTAVVMRKYILDHACVWGTCWQSFTHS